MILIVKDPVGPQSTITIKQVFVDQQDVLSSSKSICNSSNKNSLAASAEDKMQACF